jgi:hypothetical protein
MPIHGTGSGAANRDRGDCTGPGPTRFHSGMCIPSRPAVDGGTITKGQGKSKSPKVQKSGDFQETLAVIGPRPRTTFSGERFDFSQLNTGTVLTMRPQHMCLGTMVVSTLPSE